MTSGDEQARQAAIDVGIDPDAIVDPLVDFFVSEEERRRLTATYVGQGKEHLGADRLIELLAFWVADEQYAIRIADIQEIIKVPDMTEVPRVPQHVLGVTSLRGTIVPVLDLRRVLGLEERPLTREARVLVLMELSNPVGVLVDRVISVVRLDRNNLEAPPANMNRDGSDLLSAVGRLNQQIIIVLEARAVMQVMEGNSP